MIKNVYLIITKLLSLTNICISVWQKCLLSVQMHLLKDTFCSGSTIHNFTVQPSLKYEWNFEKNVCMKILATQEKIYNYTSIFWHWWWDHWMCTQASYTELLVSHCCPCQRTWPLLRSVNSSSMQPCSWKIHGWTHQFRMSALAGGWIFKYHIA